MSRRPSTLAAEWLHGTISALPTVIAIGGASRVWENEAPDEIGRPVVVFQRIGAGRGVAPIGGPNVAAVFRYQWRVGTTGADTSVLDDLAEEIGEALRYVNTTLPTGEALGCWEIDPDLAALPPADGAAAEVELGGEVEIYLSWTGE